MPVSRLAIRLAGLSLLVASASFSSPSQVPAPGNVESWMAALSAADPRTRAAAAEALGRARQHEAVLPLIGLLQDPDLHVRNNAAQSLGAIGDAAATEPLIRVLEGYGPQREIAAVALGQIGDRRAVVPLYVAFGGPEKSVQHAAATSLASLGEAGASLLEQGLAGSKAAIERLVAEDDGRLLARVLDFFDKWHPISREEAVWALGSARDERTIPFFVHAASNPSSKVRTAAVWCIGRIQPAAALSTLIRASTDDYDGVREAAAWALGELRDPAAVAPLVGALEDPAPAVREAAAWALKKTADLTAAVPLAHALADRDEKVRIAAAYAVGQFHDPATAQSLVSLLATDRAAGVREAAAWSLARSGDERAPESLLRSLRDASPAVRVAAATGLGDLADSRAAGVLLEAAVDGDDAVRAAAAASLDRLHEPLGRLLLERARGNLAPPSERLDRQGTDASTASIEALDSPKEMVRRTAALYLGEVGDVRAADGLTAMSSAWDLTDRVIGMASLHKLRGRGIVQEISTAVTILTARSSVTYYAALTALFAVLLSAGKAARRRIPLWTRVGIASLLAGLALTLPAHSATWTYLGLVLACIVPFALIRAATSRWSKR